MRSFRAWRAERVRYLGTDSCYVRLTPNVGIGLPWFGRRLRWAPHHGLQLVVWRNNRWLVAKQLLGKSTVKGERNASIFPA